jgi:hypothetical protein
MTQPVAGFGFLPWLRRGLAGQIGRADGDPTPAARAVVDVTVVVDAAGEERPLAVALPLLGPGEVAGLDPRTVIRVAPKPGELDAEPNELPMVEFAEPDLPWRYTPAVADAKRRLRPWLVLAVLRAEEIIGQEPAGADGRLPVITVADARALPRLDQSWAWAHVQVDGFQPASESLSTVHPRRQRARLLAPRRLAAKTAYTAVLVPALERGRRAGLREPTPDAADGLAAAWEPDATQIRLPVYYRWSFQTGEQADFEQLARRLVGRPADPAIGTIAIDVRTPDPALPGAATAPLVFTGALVSPAAVIPPWPADERSTYIAALAALLNRPADALVQATDADPIVAPPLWGRWHAAVDRLDPTGAATPMWYHELNADPRLRTTAGLGAEVVRRHDQELMAQAWDQIDGVLAANEALRRAQAAREAAVKLHAKHLSTLDVETLLQVTAPVHGRVLADRPISAAEELRRSPIPDGATDGRVRRARGALARRTARMARRPGRAGADGPGQPGAEAPGAGAPAATDGLLHRLNTQQLRTRPVIAAPTGMVVTTLTAPAPGTSGLAGTATHAAVGRASVLAEHVVAPPTEAADVMRPVELARPAAGFTPGVAGGVLETGGAAHIPVPLTSDVRDHDAVTRAAARFGQAMVRLVADVGAEPAAGPVLRRADLSAMAATVRKRLDPAQTVAAGIRGRLRLASWVRWEAEDPLEPVMAAPEFDTPMYEPLRDLGHDWLLPGAGRIPPDTVTAVLPNQSFIEAYLLGLSYEMGRELLFHEYPTDQRGTYFPQFWDTRGALTPSGAPADEASLRDITPIHRWRSDAGLGANVGRTPPPPPGHLVLLVKGELFRRFPDTLVSAVEAVVGADGRRTLGSATLHPMFSGRLEPDIAFFGFDLTVDRARGGPNDLGWFFVLAEHPTEPRFGLDADNADYAGQPTAWPDLSWAHLAASAQDLAGLDYVDLAATLPDVGAVVPAAGDPPVAWHVDAAPSGANGGDLAWITLRRPFRVAIHGADVLPGAAT